MSEYLIVIRKQITYSRAKLSFSQSFKVAQIKSLHNFENIHNEIV